MNPGRLRRYAVRLVAAASLGLGLLVISAGGAQTQDSNWNFAGGSSGSSEGVATFTPLDSNWN